ncbi:MAG: response regulator [Oligoflexia bacterium]|nr:response regulator [Oligoflexia bacterium]
MERAFKICIIDDSKTVRDELRTLLEKEKYEIVEADDGLNGLKILGQNRDVNLIVTDVNMPNMDGIIMCRKIKEDELLKDIPIMMFTTQSGTAELEQGKEIGITSWLTKPLVPDKFLKVANAILNKKIMSWKSVLKKDIA